MTENDQNLANPATWKLMVIASTATFYLMLPANSLIDIARYFHRPAAATEHVISWFLLGFGLGPLIFGPLTNYFGRKKSLFYGLVLAVLATLGALLATYGHSLTGLCCMRLLTGIGTSSGVVVATILLKETRSDDQARYEFSLMVLFSSVAPILAITLGGYVTAIMGFKSLFWLMLFGLIAQLYISKNFVETYEADPIPLDPRLILTQYGKGMLETPFIFLVTMTTGAAGVMFLFNGLSPLMAATFMHTPITEFSNLALIPCAGFVVGSLLNGRLTRSQSTLHLIQLGQALMLITGLWMIAMLTFVTQVSVIQFMIPSFFLFAGIAIVVPNAALASISSAKDVAIGTAIFNSFNLIASALMLNLASHFIQIGPMLLPMICCVLVLTSIGIAFYWRRQHLQTPEHC